MLGVVISFMFNYGYGDSLGIREGISSLGKIPLSSCDLSKEELKTSWSELSDMDKWILMMVSEYCHLTFRQLLCLVGLPSLSVGNDDADNKMIMDKLFNKAYKATVNDDGVIVVPSEWDDNREDVTDVAGKNIQKENEEKNTVNKNSEKETRESLDDKKIVASNDTNDNISLENNVDYPVNDWFNGLLSFFYFVSLGKYGVKLLDNNVLGVSVWHVFESLKFLVSNGFIELVYPSYKVTSCSSDLFNMVPFLFRVHLFLSVRGGRLLVENTNITSASSGYNPNYRSAYYTSIVHAAETNDIFSSLIDGILWFNNVCWLNRVLGREYYDISDVSEYYNQGIDIVRYYHEKDCEYKNVEFYDSANQKKNIIDFKSDGLLTVFNKKDYVFVDLFLEYDSGTSKAASITHKLEAFIRYVLWQRELIRKKGLSFSSRKFVLLLVSQNTGDYKSILKKNKKKHTMYERGIYKALRKKYSELGKEESLNSLLSVYVTDCDFMRNSGAFGSCWHQVNLEDSSINTNHVSMIDIIGHDSLDDANQMNIFDKNIPIYDIIHHYNDNFVNELCSIFENNDIALKTFNGTKDERAFLRNNSNIIVNNENYKEIDNVYEQVCRLAIQEQEQASQNNIDENENIVKKEDKNKKKKKKEKQSVPVTQTKKELAYQDFFSQTSNILKGKVPSVLLGTDVLGLRTRGTMATSIPFAKGKETKQKLRELWSNGGIIMSISELIGLNNLTNNNNLDDSVINNDRIMPLNDLSKWVLLLLSEHKHLTYSQLEVFTVLASRAKKMGHNSIKPLFAFTLNKYGLNNKTSDVTLAPCYSKTFTATSTKTLEKCLNEMIKNGFIKDYQPSFILPEEQHFLAKEYPALYEKHYYLTPLGANLIKENTLIAENQIGYVPTQANASYHTIIKETEINEILTILITEILYYSNKNEYQNNQKWEQELLNKAPYLKQSHQPPNQQVIDITRWYDEKNSIITDLEYTGHQPSKTLSQYLPDAYISYYNQTLNQWSRIYLEYDDGTTKEKLLAQKIETFIGTISKTLNKQNKTHENTPLPETPSLLIITQKPSTLDPTLQDKTTGTTYTQSIKHAINRILKGEYKTNNPKQLQENTKVYMTGTQQIKTNGILNNPNIKKLDMTTGQIDQPLHNNTNNN